MHVGPKLLALILLNAAGAAMTVGAGAAAIEAFFRFGAGAGLVVSAFVVAGVMLFVGSGLALRRQVRKRMNASQSSSADAP